jgi:outer membrane protein TolC
METSSLVKKIAQSRSALESMRLNETLAEKTYRLTEEAYRFGTKDILSLQSARDSLAQARLDVSKEAYTLRAAVLDLEYALGVPFGTLGR